MNVLEHIKNYENCLRTAYDALSERGIFLGLFPFLYKVHKSPNDYFRYTDTLIEEKLQEIGFEKIEVKVICGGVFLSTYAIIFDLSKKIPFLNIPILFLCIFR